MNDEGIEVLKALRSFKKVADKFDVQELHPIATAAIRQSKIEMTSLSKSKRFEY